MPLVSRQQHELWLTAAQSLFAVVLISEFAFERWEAVALLVPFVAQLVLPPSIGGFDVRMTFTVLYVLAALGLMLDAHRRRAVAVWPQSIVESLAQPGESRRTRAKPKGGRTAA
jgi:cation:H+ antiporter